jgi:predicted  nucleic acid-binding Zn-ribbon protein
LQIDPPEFIIQAEMSYTKDDVIMTQLLDQLSETETALASAEDEISRWTAEVAGLRAKREVLADAINQRKLDVRPSTIKSSVVEIPDLREIRTRKAALVSVLEALRTELHTNEIIAKLREGGRKPGEDEYATVAATLHALSKEGVVINTRRGYWKIA